MTDEPVAAGGEAAAGPGAGPPALNVLAQYVRDLSFENPNAPQSLANRTNPSIRIDVNVNARPLADTDYEVELRFEVKAQHDDEIIFAVELAYGGIFRLVNIPPDNVQPLLLIECPRILFPFARQIVATATREGGFPPLMIDPIDFVALYRQRMGEAAGKVN